MSDTFGVYEVFTPTTPAKINFVSRENIENRLADCILTPGKQIIIYGETGCGKSTLLEKKLEELYEFHITTRCTKSTTYQSMLLDAFDKLSASYHSSTVENLPRGRKNKIEANLGALKLGSEGQGGGYRQTESK